VELIIAGAIRRIEDAGFVVQRPQYNGVDFRPDISYVPNEELDRRPAA
jgi:hypothetical protein